MKLAEPLFKTLQGEGIHTGLPTIFIRLAGCNLACQWCDTKYSLTTKGSTELTVEQIGEGVLKFKPQYQDWVCITGGEPLMQEKELRDLVTLLTYKYGLKVEIFTNSSYPRPTWYTKATWCADIKCPGSGIDIKKLQVEDWFNTRQDIDQVKFVVGNKADLDFTRDWIHRYAVESPIVLVSPMCTSPSGSHLDPEVGWEVDWLREVWNFCVEEKVRLSLQVHKIVFGNRKGV